MKIYYRGYLIDEREGQSPVTVYGTNPGRCLVALSPDTEKAMHWVDGDIERRTYPTPPWHDWLVVAA